MTLTVSNLLGALPPTLRDELFSEFNKLLKNYREGRWEPAELEGGKLCEIVYSILRGYTTGTYPSKSSKPAQFKQACDALEQLSSASFSRSVRIQIPRILIALYEVRNNRGVGHVGGDVDPNRMDATFVIYSAKWLVAELIRIFHQVTVDEANSSIELIVQREVEDIWTIGNKKRVLKAGLDAKKQTLRLLYSCIDGKATVDELCDWVEYSTKSNYKTKVLNGLHSDRLVEWDQNNGNVHLSPLGIEAVEAEL
ncbi:hypothetical protein [Puia dinghuensis]|uniref:Uncharacterized protein n=1 Tax=Puia dinghuensis TaxID=1792502 RepID=A0A8J2UDA7_9BACT|nr:hypothetical protein [Puia dinghuensis]GGB01425.1 hypothetical protein GCM10011511_25930 [Puia dinghuensis]